MRVDRTVSILRHSLLFYVCWHACCRSGCLQHLNSTSAATASSTIVEACKFAAFLVTAMFVLGCAPRSQVLRALRLNKTFRIDTDRRYWIRVGAADSKNRKPVLVPMPMELTDAFDKYIQSVRVR